jgi:hypothetical protein
MNTDLDFLFETGCDGGMFEMSVRSDSFFFKAVPQSGQYTLNAAVPQEGQTFAASPARVPQFGQKPDINTVLQLLHTYFKSFEPQLLHTSAISAFSLLQ